MSHISPGTAVGQVPQWTGGYFKPAIISPGGPTPALANSIWGSRKICMLFQNGDGGATVLGNWTNTVTTGGNSSVSITKTDAFLAFSWGRTASSTTTADSVIFQRNSNASGAVWIGNAAGLGGFYLHGTFGVPDTLLAHQNLFCGYRALTTAPAGGAEPSSLVDILGFGFDDGDTNIFFMNNDGSGTATKNDTGLAIGAGRRYEYAIYAAPNSGTVTYSIQRRDGGAVSSLVQGSVSTNTPTVNTSLFWNLYSSNNSSTGTTFHVYYGSQYQESDAAQ